MKDAAGEDIVLSTDEDKLVLTEKAGKQLVKDRLEYSTLLQNDISNKSAKTQAEAQKQFAKTQAKAIAVFRSLSDGKIVPDSDEKKLMEYDPKLYQMAKMAQMLAQRTKEDAEKKKSEWDPIQEEKDRICRCSDQPELHPYQNIFLNFHLSHPQLPLFNDREFFNPLFFCKKRFKT